MLNHKPITKRRTSKDEKDSRKKWQWGCIIDGKEIGEGHVISRILGELITRRSRGNPKSSNSFLFIFYSLSFRAL